MASSAADARSTGFGTLQIAGGRIVRSAAAAVESWLEAERDQLPLWLPVMLGAGIAIWFLLPTERDWMAAGLALLAVALAGAAVGQGGRAARVVMLAALAAAIGLGLIWWKAERVAAPVLDRATIATFDARVVSLDPLPARDLVRLRLAVLRVQADVARREPAPALPPMVRVNIATADAPAGLERGSVIRLRARLMPPPGPAVPGAYDYAKVAWFDGIGATGHGFAPVAILSGGGAAQISLRHRLSAHIQRQLSGSAGAIAATLATGDEGGIATSDADAMRRAGLAHLLSISGLHVTAVVGAVMLVVLRLLALSPWLALHVRLPLVAAGAGALAAVGYTLLTGAEVPTVRSCVAALLVLAALATGREPLTLRLVAAGAMVVLCLWPETLTGPSFQLSFAAVTAIIALHDHPRVRRWFAPRDDGRGRRLLRGIGSLLLTGLVVEWTLMPIALFHFHKSGIYGAIANIVAIPLTTFVVMPFEALALLLDPLGLGAPAWWVAGHGLTLLLWIAHTTAAAPGSMAMLPSMPTGAFAAIVSGGLWVALWRTRWRWLGVVPLVLGAGWAMTTPAPDLLVTGDGRHVALRTPDGTLAILRERAGDYTVSMLSENGGVDGDPVTFEALAAARCSRDLCLVDQVAGGRTWRVLATRSAYLVPKPELGVACAGADIAISERRLPSICRPRWLKLDAPTLRRTGGVAIALGTGRIATVRQDPDAHPWRAIVSRNAAGDRRAGPAHGPARGRSAADHRRGWRDRGAP